MMEFIDAHHHLWDLSACHYPWLEAKGESRFFGDPSPIQQNYLLEDFRGEADAFIPRQSVHIQVGVAPGAELEETRWVSEAANQPEALVCFVDLTAADREQRLDAQQQFPRVRGVRQILGRHRDEDLKHGSDALIDHPSFHEGLKSLAARHLSFDLQLIPEQHQRVATLLETVPDLSVALCHAGSPWDQTPAGIAQWRKGIAVIARRPNTVVKLSGLGMFNRQWDIESLKPIFWGCIETFGPERVMVGSNFPVDKLYHSYERWWSAVETLLAPCSNEERAQILCGTAETFYRLSQSASESSTKFSRQRAYSSE